MQNDMRDKLKDLFKRIQYTPSPEQTMKANLGNRFTEYALNCIVDDLITNGVMLPPCKVGDTVYFIPKYITNWIHDDVEYIKITKDSFIIKTVADWYFDEEDFGKTVFLTKEQAEQKLKEMRVNNDLQRL